MSRESLHRLLDRYLKGECTEQEKKTVENWYALLDIDKEEIQHVSEEELASIDERIWNNIQQQSEKTSESVPVTRKLWFRLLAAASVLVLVALAIFLVKLPEEQPIFLSEKISTIQQVINTEATPLQVTLPDSSTVTLQPQASLEYPENFSEYTREVTLTGEGLFNVSSNPQKPFLVYSNNLLTKVVGTSFIVKAAADGQESEVSVITGKVIVIKNKKKKLLDILPGEKTEEVVLTPNHKAVYNAQTNELIATLVSQPLMVEEPEQKAKFLYQATSIAQVFSDLQQAYNIEIVSENKEIKACTFTGDISGQELYDMLDFICQSVGASYRVEKTKIIVKGGAC